MNFSEHLNNYMHLIQCSAKELSEASAISSSVISRYRNNEKLPNKDSKQIESLSNAIAQIASQKDIESIKYDEVFLVLNNSLENKTLDYEIFSKNFHNLIIASSLNMSELARFLNFDPSYLSRIRNGQRKPGKPEIFIDKICHYIICHCNTEPQKKAIANLIDCDSKEISIQLLKNWLCSTKNKNYNYIDDFLKILDEFNLDKYISSLRFNDIKIPSFSFKLSTSKNYYGIEEMKKSELDFFKATILSKNSTSVFMCNDMAMENMEKDTEFRKKWMLAIAMLLKKGLSLNVIHNIDRPFKEMMLGLESWIPIYITGEISSYYLKNASNNNYCHINYVSDTVALSGECISGYPNSGKCYLTNNKDEVAYYKEKINTLLKKASPLMEIYKKNKSNEYNEFLSSISKLNGNRTRILSTLPIFTISEKTLNEILDRNSISEIDKSKIYTFVKEQKKLLQNITIENKLLDIITELSKEDFENQPVHLSLSDMYFDNKIYYTYDEYLSHINTTLEYANINKNYSVQTNKKNIFKNIQILINEKSSVIISKENTPTIHFVIHHPKLCSSIENFLMSAN